MPKLTQHQLIVNFLRKHPNLWVPSHHLQQTTLLGEWIGSRGSRSARDLASNTKIAPELMNTVETKEGKELISIGITKDWQGKDIGAVYAYYKAIGPKGFYTVNLPSGEVKQIAMW